ncbi:MAG TPA: hypothetical protein VMI31_13170, partial [Fimbriimonadaceae bacterium]|nr:hypothetical protein [Fimbriimonadaceae bacterium]
MPDAVANTIVIIALLLLVAPYAVNKDFGIFKTPDWEPRQLRTLKYVGPLAFVCVSFAAYPLWPGSVSKDDYDLAVTLTEKQSVNARLAAIHYFEKAAYNSVDHHWFMIEQLTASIRAWAGPSTPIPRDLSYT